MTVPLALLTAAVAGVYLRPGRLPHWVVPALMVAIGLGVGAIEPATLTDALDPLRAPLAFLLLAVPLAVMLDQLGFFTAVAARIDHSHHLHLGLWLFAAAVTTLFNLDASVVLLTPLYVRIARRHGLDVTAAAFVPALLACLASSALPVSNLTNLVAAERFDVGAGDFLLRLGPASLAAVAVGYRAHRRAFPEPEPGDAIAEPENPHALRLGAPVVVFVIFGFTVGEAWGFPAWVVAALADVWLLALLRKVPWRATPLGAAGLAAALGVLAAAAAPDLQLGWALDGSGAGSAARIFTVAVLGANALNNLPALLVALPVLEANPGSRLWLVLLGVNVGPVLAATGSLAGLLWLDTTRRLHVPVHPRTYTSVGVRVGLPALVAAFLVLVATNALIQ